MTGTSQNRSAQNPDKRTAQGRILIGSECRKLSAHRGSRPEPVTLTGSVPRGEPVRTEPVRSMRSEQAIPASPAVSGLGAVRDVLELAASFARVLPCIRPLPQVRRSDGGEPNPQRAKEEEREQEPPETIRRRADKRRDCATDPVHHDPKE